MSYTEESKIHYIPADAKQHIFKTVDVTHLEGNTKAVVVTADALPLLGFAEGESPTSVVNALKSAMEHRAPVLQGVIVEESELGIELVDADNNRWIPTNRDNQSMVAGIDYLLSESAQRE